MCKKDHIWIILTDIASHTLNGNDHFKISFPLNIILKLWCDFCCSLNQPYISVTPPYIIYNNICSHFQPYLRSALLYFFTVSSETHFECKIHYHQLSCDFSCSAIFVVVQTSFWIWFILLKIYRKLRISALNHITAAALQSVMSNSRFVPDGKH